MSVAVIGAQEDQLARRSIIIGQNNGHPLQCLTADSLDVLAGPNLMSVFVRLRLDIDVALILRRTWPDEIFSNFFGPVRLNHIYKMNEVSTGRKLASVRFPTT